jgi:hypothetical protein
VIGIWVLQTQGFKPLNNRWVGILVIFMVFSSAHSPNIKFDSVFIPKDSGIFNFKPMFESLVFFLMFCGVQSMSLSQEQIQKIFKTITITALIYSIYIIIQRLGLDQIYIPVGTELSQLSRNPEAGGFISQPVFAGAFLAMCLPFAIRYKNYIITALILVAIIATGNRTALIACGFVAFAMHPRTHKYILIAVGLYVLAISLAFISNINVNDSGRFTKWHMILEDFYYPAFPGINKANILTGYGIGSFSVLFPFYHNTEWAQAHNELLESFYTMGVVGLSLFVLSMSRLLETIKDNAIFAGLIAIFICSLTNPVWHVAQLQFITILLAGFGLNAGFNAGLNKERLCIS